MKKKTYSMVLTSLFGAIISVISIIPTGINILGMPVTLQTFAVALAAYVLGAKKGVMATIIYILLGMIGLPVFSGFKGGVGVIFSVTGGFIVGFIPLSIFVGVAIKLREKIFTMIVSFMGLIVCYIIGTIWFAFISRVSIVNAVLAVALPYLLKDVLMLLAAYPVAIRIRKSIKILEK